MDLTKLRILVSAVAANLGRVESEPSDRREQAVADLKVSWNTLVDTLALGPEPPTRACPRCKGIIMRDALRCVHCWEKSVAPA